MAVLVVGRLRVKDPNLVDEFVSAASAVVEQAMHSRGNLDADVLAEADNTYWIRTAWLSQRFVTDFLDTEPHRTSMSRVEAWCDEASFVHWEQPDTELPDWQRGYRRLIADGKPVPLADGTPSHRALGFPPPGMPAS